MQKSVYNPYLPSFEYVPDGEPHVFGERVYIYGSHDRFDGALFCLNDYVCYSADVKDLTNWRYEGVIYKKEQDPRNQNIPEDAPEPEPAYGIPHEVGQDNLNPPGVHAMWAPDVVKGPDGKYYLYYCLDWLPEIGVAVCDEPAGKYEFLGLVKHKDGTPVGCKKEDYISFDPGIFVDDDGSIYLYSGNAPMRPEMENFHQASVVMRLEKDMLTLAEEPKLLMPTVLNSQGTGFEGHEFFEASSIRKIKDRYYFVYSSVNSHELCYAVSDRPDSGYTYGGTLVDIGDVYLDGREAKDALNCLGNTHGGIECVDGQWYVFYHRQTNRTNFSRQACAEKIYIQEDGFIPQVEVTSCGLHKGPLKAAGMHPANCCCRLQSAIGAVFSHPKSMGEEFPYLTQDVKDMEPNEENTAMDRVDPVLYITNMKDGAVAGYKYFQFEGETEATVKIRGRKNSAIKGFLEASCTVSGETRELGRISVETKQGDDWTEFSGKIEAPAETAAVTFTFHGEGALDLKSFSFQ